MSPHLRTRRRPEVPATVLDDPELPRIEVNGRRFHAEVHGSESAPVVVVLHGGPGGDYRSLLCLAALADRHRVVFFDQRGAGLSERVPAEELTAGSALADLDAIIGSISPQRPVTLIGHSWGATLAVGYIRHRPARVNAAVLAEPGYLDRQEYLSWQARYDEMMSGPSYLWLALRAGLAARRVKGPDEHAVRDYLVGRRILPAFLDHPDNPYHLPGARYGAPSWRWGSVAGEALAGETFGDTAGGASRFGGPVLFLAGAHNTWIGEELQARHAAAFAHARVAVVEGAGHDMFWDNPAGTLTTIRRFLDTEGVAGDTRQVPAVH